MINRNVADAVIINSRKEFLLQKKTLTYLKSPGRWTFFGGKIEKGELPEKAVERELKEELGIEIKKTKLFKIESYKLQDISGKVFIGKRYIFIIKFNSEIADISISEGAGFAFFDRKELNEINMDKFCKRTLIEYIGNDRK